MLKNYFKNDKYHCAFLKVVRDSEHIEKFRKNSKTTNFAIILSHEIYKFVQ